MPNKFLITILSSLFFCFSILGQDNEKKKKLKLPKEVVVDSIIEIRDPINPLSPAKAAFFSAVLPGLGQAYNKKYWKIPIVYAALGTGVYFYIENTDQYNRYRDAFKSRLTGRTDDEFYAQGTTTETLEEAQEFYRKNREISLLVTVGLYALNIIDANVDAHLLQYNVDENLSLSPHYKINERDATTNLGLTLNFKF